MQHNETTTTYTYHFPCGSIATVEVTPQLADILSREDRIETSNNQRNRTRAGRFLSLEQLIEQKMQFTTDRDNIEHRQAIRLLRRLMAELPEEKTTLLRLHWQQGLCPTEIGRRLGISRQAVNRQLARLYDQMEKQLTEMGAVR